MSKIHKIPGYPGHYITKRGKVYRKRYGEYIIKPQRLVGRYLYVSLRVKEDKKSYTLKVHRLVALTFIPNPNNYPLVMHRDNDPLNNHKNNLKWGTHQMNSNQMVEEGRQGKRTKKYSKEICKKIVKLRSKGLSWNQIADKLDIPFGSVRNLFIKVDTYPI